ncbi:hypothetical protein FHT91_002175 [Rhizobium sp. BK347]|uniref:Cold-shock protein n=1 Tax=Rhizobium tropici TaxID=398 RepID=A0A329Y2U3_RHITR|nr:hypothetical protein [Rhizobium sp. BK252]MBB3401535.1 hypothetical protein [Rhizobium sp. BK289]MBB3482409.1 hypothetical protein [Rhizobium sp. BK347]RAX37617.1 cold-shock protein [Rhizobium tropici]
MQNPRYRIGDTIILKRGILGNSGPLGRCQIISYSPEADGAAQYRVRFEGEKFERRVLHTDIDVEASPALPPNIGFPSGAKPSGWVHSIAISARKR